MKECVGLNKGLHNEVIDDVVRVDYGNFFNYRKKKKEDREVIVEMIRENPCITAKQIASELKISLSGANYKIKTLKKGRIRFDGKGGRGKWMIIYFSFTPSKSVYCCVIINAKRLNYP